MNNLPVPEYEDTGYVGRKRQIEALKKSILQGAYPITVFGDGGIGKTALTLKVAYEILESAQCPFEAVVWTSAKSQQLTSREISRIRDAITDSAQMLGNIAEYLGAQDSVDPMQEILAYLSQFRILLIMDNLETVLDESILSLLRNFPQRSGSKIVITSRIGMGAFDEPFRLQPMEEGEAIQLLRALAEIRQVSELTKLTNKQLKSYCARMQHNPLFIRWFVSTVQTGLRPEEVFEHRGVFLEFCMSNVHNHLSDASREILRCLLCLPGKHSLPELAFLTDMDAVKVGEAIRELRTTSMITLATTQRDAATHSTYGLTSLARDYLVAHHPVKVETQRLYLKRKQQILGALEQMNAEIRTDPYSFYSIERRTPSDVIVAKYLFDALNARKRKNFTRALELIELARNLAPQYFEVHRVEAIIRASQGDYLGAQAAYETALEFNPKSAPVHCWYGGFLLRHMLDTEAAYSELLEASRLDPNSWTVQLELGRAALYLRRFTEAESSIKALLVRLDEMQPALQRRVYDSYLQLYSRQADYLALQRDWQGCLETLERLKVAYGECPPDMIDHLMRIRLRKVFPVARRMANHVESEIDSVRARRIIQWLDEVSESDWPIPNSAGAEDAVLGEVIRVDRTEGQAMILSEEGEEYWFRRSDLATASSWSFLSEGSKVLFWVAVTDESSNRAYNVLLEEDDT